MGKAVILSPTDFRRLQLAELPMIQELDRVCRANNINYVLVGGSMLGAVRHKGYIPWDDDADIAMLREDYDKFKQHINELDPKICFFQDHDTDPDYLWGYGKLRRTGTTYVRVGQEHMKGKTGIFIDIFPMDDIPLSTVGQMLQDFHCFCLRKTLWASVGRYNARGPLKLCYSLLSHVPADFVYRQLHMYTRNSKNATPNRVRTLLFPASGKLYRKNPIRERYGMPKKWFLERAEYDFEGCRFYGTKEYDEVLTYFYGDYMEPPPVGQREQHAPFSKIIFPPESKEDIC